MSQSPDSLMIVYEGWDGYRESIRKAVAPLNSEQLSWCPAAELRTVGELARHFALGPIDWFIRMDAPGSHELADQIDAWEEDRDGNRYVVENAVAITDQTSELLKWLDASWGMIDRTLKTWTVEDLKKSFQHTWRGNKYTITRQWSIWRIMAHDLHHGGELAVMLGMQGLKNFELGDLGGHIIEPPSAEEL